MRTAFVLLLVLVASSADRLWTASVGRHSVPVNHVDFRGHYGPEGNLDLYVVEETRLDPFASTVILGPYTDTDRLWVAECQAEKDCVESGADILGRFVLPGRRGASFAVVVKSDERPKAKGAESVISVPTTPVVLHRRATGKRVNFTAGEPDPLIKQFVDSISRNELTQNVATLSSIFSRLSFASGAFEAQRLIESRFRSLGLTFTSEEFRNEWSNNVCAEIRGRVDPHQIVIVGAHYDCRASDSSNVNQRAPGADDNGSGSSNVLEIARVFSGYPRGFAKTVRFCLWSGEEQGLVGSRAYAAKLKEDGAELLGYLNGDMLGYKPASKPLLVGMKDRFVDMDLTEMANEITRTYVPGIPIEYSPSCCSDQQSFYENGFPAVAYFESELSASANPNYHQSSDLPATLDYELLHTLSKTMTAMLATLAQPVRN